MRTTATLPFLPLALLLAASACNGDPEDTDVEQDTFEWATCTDEDGDGRCAEDADCDDSDPEVYRGRREICNGIDDNCNELVDEGLADADQDGTCDAQDTEECDGLDNDGDSLIDEDFADGDGDGVADCVDAEICDGLDNDGDGEIDDGFDADGDGATQCGDIDGQNQDCDDGDGDIFPGATEVEDQADNDCDGLVDEGDWMIGDLIITEVMVNPDSVADPDGEWFEVVNASGRAVYLDGLQIQDSNGQNHQIAPMEPLLLEDGAHAVLGTNARPDTNGRVPVDYEYRDVTLLNDQDDLRLVAIDETPTETIITELDSVAWDASYPVQAGASLMLEPTRTGDDLNDDAVSWCPAYEEWTLGSDLGTPGEPNDDCLTFDQDGDGFGVADGDCDDADPAIYPGAPEVDGSVDNDCDGDIEEGPTAVAEVSTLSANEVCGLTYLDGSATTDPNGDPIERWSWTLDTAPEGSSVTTADIRNADTSFASFEADVDGSYTFELVAFDDGGAASAPASVSVTVDPRTDNTDPIADAGGNQVADDTSSCETIGGVTTCSSCVDRNFTIDAGASRDREGDSLTYSWTVTSGAGVVADRTAESTTVRVSGATPTPTSRGTSTVFIDLVVTDCMGGVSETDTIAIVYTCEAD